MGLETYKEARELIFARLPDDSFDYCGPVAADDVSVMEQVMGWRLPPSYHQFLLDFGSLRLGGEEVLGLFRREEHLHLEAIEQTELILKMFEGHDPGLLMFWSMDVDLVSYWLNLSTVGEDGESPVLQLGFDIEEGLVQVYSDFGDCLLDFVKEEIELIEESEEE